MKLNEFKHLIRTIVNESINETELDEMARIANLIQPGDEAALADAKAKFKGTWVEKMIDHVIANPNGSTKIDLAQAAGKPRQQDVNPVVNKLMDSGAFVMGGLVTPKKEKVPTSGIQGRPVKDLASLSDEEKIKRLIKQIKNYLRGVELSSGNPSPAPRQMDIDWFDGFSGGQYEGLYNVVEAYVTSPSAATEDAVYSFLTSLGFQVRKRGAPMKPAAPAPGEDMPLEEKLMMQKRAGIISEEEYNQKKKLGEIAITPEMQHNQKIMLSKHAKSDIDFKKYIPTLPGEEGKENVEKRNIAKKIVDKIKEKESLNSNELAAELNLPANEIYQIVKSLSIAKSLANPPVLSLQRIN